MVKFSEFLFSGILPLGKLSWIIFEIAIGFLPIAIPLSLLFSAVYCVSKLSKNSELVALRASGRSRLRIMLPFLFISVISGACLYLLEDRPIPLAKRDVKRTIIEISNEGILQNLKSGKFFNAVSNLNFFAKTVKEKGKILEDVFINFFEKEEEQSVIAKKGSLIKDGRNITLRLFDGSMVVYGKDKQIQKLFFDEYEIPFYQGSKFSNFHARGSSLTGEEIRRIFKRGAKKSRLSKKNFNKVKFEYFNRFNNPILCFLFTLLGFILGSSSHRGKSRKGLLLFASMIAYYIVFFSLVSSGKSGKIPMPLAVFAPTGLLTVLITYYYYRYRWES